MRPVIGLVCFRPFSTRLVLLAFLPFFILFFNDTPTPEIYTLSLHDALPISRSPMSQLCPTWTMLSSFVPLPIRVRPSAPDRKSTRLNSSHLGSSYAVFCLKKKKKTRRGYTTSKR